MQEIKDKESGFIGRHSELKIDPVKYIEEDAKSIMKETLAIFFKTLPHVTPSNVEKKVPKRAEKAVKEESKPDKTLDEIGELKVEIAKKLWEIKSVQDFEQKNKEINALINENIDKLRATAEEKESLPVKSDIESIVHMLRINDLERFNKKFSDKVAFDNFDRKKWIKSLKLNSAEKKKFYKQRTHVESVVPEPAENSHSSSSLRKAALLQKKVSSEVARIKTLAKENSFKKRSKPSSSGKM